MRAKSYTAVTHSSNIYGDPPVCQTMPLALGLRGERDTVLALEELLPVGEAVRETAHK